MQKIRSRFRGFLPIVVDIETGGLNPKTDALLEISIVSVFSIYYKIMILCLNIKF